MTLNRCAFALLVSLYLVMLGAVVAHSAEKDNTCPDQLMQARSTVGVYQSDYTKKVQELAASQVQVYLLQQKVKMLEEAAKPKHEDGK